MSISEWHVCTVTQTKTKLILNFLENIIAVFCDIIYCLLLSFALQPSFAETSDCYCFWSKNCVVVWAFVNDWQKSVTLIKNEPCVLRQPNAFFNSLATACNVFALQSVCLTQERYRSQRERFTRTSCRDKNDEKQPSNNKKTKVKTIVKRRDFR